MNTAAIDSLLSTTSSTTTTASQELDKEAFLQLLVAQLQNQDPTSAQDPTTMIQQMVGYSQLEQLQNMNTALETLQLQNQGIFQAEATSLVGKKVRVTSTSFNLEEGSATVGVDVGANAASLTLTIKDTSGSTVAILNEGSQSAGTHLFTWNGQSSDGTSLTDGTYTVEVIAKDADGNAVTANPSAYITVESILFSNGTVLLMAGGKSFTLDAVNEVCA